MNNDFPVLDGIVPSWADIIVRATPSGGPLISIAGIKSIETDVTVTVSEQRGASGGRVMARTTGAVAYTAKATLYRSGYDELIEKLGALAPTRGKQQLISLVHFGITVQHTPPGSSKIFECRIKGCRLLGRNLASAEGTDAQTVDVVLNPLEIVDIKNGKEVAWL